MEIALTSSTEKYTGTVVDPITKEEHKLEFALEYTTSADDVNHLHCDVIHFVKDDNLIDIEICASVGAKYAPEDVLFEAMMEIIEAEVYDTI